MNNFKNNFIFFLLLLSLSMNSQNYDMTRDFANLKKYAAENEKLGFDSVGKIVFMGDSITEFWKTTDESFFTTNSFIDRGISGQTTSQMVVRFSQDVVNLKPSTVVILAGINDIAQNNGPISLEDIMKNIASMAETAKKFNIKVVLCSVLPANKFPWRPEILPAEKVIKLNKLIEDYAFKNKIVYVDYYSKMVDENQGLKSEFGDDGVHPNLAGYKVMEAIILKEITSKSK